MRYENNYLCLNLVHSLSVLHVQAVGVDEDVHEAVLQVSVYLLLVDIRQQANDWLKHEYDDQEDGVLKQDPLHLYKDHTLLTQASKHLLS